jgi:hypothetical protein
VPLPPTQVQLSLTALLLAPAVALVPVDSARLVRRGGTAPAEVEETLGRLRGRVDRQRAAAGLRSRPARSPAGPMAARLLQRRRGKGG